MIEDFRGAVGAVAEAAAHQPSQLRPAVSAVFRLADRVPADIRIEGLAALSETLRAHQWSAAVAADVALLCGAIVESGVPAGPAGMEVMRQLAEYGKLAGVFLHTWHKTGDDAPPHPSQVSDASEQRVTPELEQMAPLATTGWWVSHRYGLAARTMLGDPGVRAALREDPRTLGELSVVAEQLRPHVEEYGEIADLLRTAEAEGAPADAAGAQWWGDAQEPGGVADPMPPAPPVESWDAPPPAESWPAPPAESWDPALVPSAEPHAAPLAPAEPWPAPPAESWDAPPPSAESWDMPPPEGPHAAPPAPPVESWEAPAPPVESWEAPAPADPWDAPRARPEEPGAQPAGRRAPGAVHMDPLPRGVSDSFGWGPSWKD